MMKTLRNRVSAVWPMDKINLNMAMEIIAIRQQLAVMKQQNKRPKIGMFTRLFWVILSWIWSGWRDVLVIVTPDTVIRWHRKGFKLFWKLKSKIPGRPKIDPEIRDQVKTMALANPTWGAPRIHGELVKLGFKVSERTVSSLMPKRKPDKKPPSQTWRTFLNNHVKKCSMDFFTVPTATFNVLFVLIILSHDRRRIVHFNVTSNPTAEWTAQQVVEAFPWDTAPKYLMRDRDGIYGKAFRNRVKGMGIKEVISALRSPWQNPFVERVIGSIRRECTDHVIVLGENHLKGILSAYIEYYHADRTHLSLGKDSPDGRPVQHAESGVGSKVIALPRVGGLHHRYVWKEAA